MDKLLYPKVFFSEKNMHLMLILFFFKLATNFDMNALESIHVQRRNKKFNCSIVCTYLLIRTLLCMSF